MSLQSARVLTGISPRSWEHPSDRAALGVLKRTGGLQDIVAALVGGTMEKSLRLLHVGGTVKVTARQFPRLRRMLERAVQVMDWPVVPEAFVANSPEFNAGVIGVKEPFIVFHSALVNSLDDAELACVVAHELGHVMAGHGLYKTVLWLLLRVSLGVLPVGELVVKAILAALREWDRMSELSADRAALLAVQGEQENWNLLMKSAGGGNLAEMSIDEFFQQAWEYENQMGLLDSIQKLLNTMRSSHPFPVVRLQELHSWASSGAYQAILDGTYARRGDPEPSAADDLRGGWEHYRDGIRRSDDPLAKAARGVGDAVGKATEGLRDALKDLLGKQGP